MASFFQPLLSGNTASEVCGNGTQWKIYCNSILPSDERLQYSYQWITFIIAIVAVGVPTILAIGERSAWAFRSWRKRRKSRNRDGALERAKRMEPSPCVDLSTVKSFGVFGKDSPVPNLGKLNIEHDLLIVALPFLTGAAATEDTDQGSFSETSSTIAGVSPSTPVLGLVDGQDLGISSATGFSPSTTIDFLFHVYHDNAVVGLVLDVGMVPSSALPLIPQIIIGLCEIQVPVVLKCHHDASVLSLVNPKFLSGLIVENACILEDGTRRDYFRSIALRDAMAKCADQRVERPNFFVGFFDRWHVRPSAAVVRRSQKLAEHFAAAFEHGRAASPTAPSVMPTKKLPLSLSAFEYLRRSETSELQSSWMQQKRLTHVGNGRRDSIEKVASLPFGELQQIIPEIDELLRPLSLPEDLQNLRSERPIRITPPDYVPYAPTREDFWERTSQGELISPNGCVPLLSEPTTAQHDAILDTQIHLRTLKMLQRASDAEMTKYLEAFQQYPRASRHYQLVQSLVAGLKARNIFIYKGLGSGFTLPDNAAEFWGVSAAHKVSKDHYLHPDSTPTEIDLFISRRCPSDVQTILHTWLAHHDVSRVERFEEELQFERALGASEEDITLPLSIRHQIDNATPAETLFLLEQIKVSSLNHHFKFGIEEQCRSVLIDQTSLQSWNHATSFGFLSGTQDMESLLRRRLQDFVRLGAQKLPSVTNLLHLYHLVDRIVVDALFSADRDKLNTLTDALLHAYDPWSSWTSCDHVDINADLFALIFFSALRKGAFEDVYVETTDRCPFFLSQRDQAAVFSELWALGSQCEAYFGMLPRDLGEIIYDRYREFLEDNPPPMGFKDKKIMTVFAKPDPMPGGADEEMGPDGPSRKDFDMSKTVINIRKKFADFGALSIFCLPAIIDILLLTFLGRGLFMTAWLGNDHLTAACYALLMSLLISAGVTGWVGSIGNYYICNYAYDNMIYFHVQRLSGGFVITILVGIVGFIIFTVKVNVLSGIVFFLYLVAISMYLNILGVMATMHQRGSPLTSGRTVLWRTIPTFFLSPLISTFSPGHDLQIYLPVAYGFLFLILIQYRSLCHEWSTWMDRIPRVTEKDILGWYNTKLEAEAGQPLADTASDRDNKATSRMVKTEEENNVTPEVKRKMGLLAFRRQVEAYSHGVLGFGATSHHVDPVVARVAKGMPYLDWLLKKDDPARPRADTLTPAWFGQVNQALKTQEQMAQGLKEHNIFILFRYARFDIGVSVGLFLVALMDRWVSIVMSAEYVAISVFIDDTARYGICFAILYFCASVMTLDGTLQKYWSGNYALSDEKLLDLDHAGQVERGWETRRRKKYLSALCELFQRLFFWFGVSCILLWVFVKNAEVVILFYAYCIAYTGVMVFQFNRCFTTDVSYHTASILCSAAVGFVVGCTIHGVYGNHEPFFTDVIALNSASLLAAALTTFFVWKDLHMRDSTRTSSLLQTGAGADAAAANCWTQPRLSNPSMAVSETAEVVAWKNLPGNKVTSASHSLICERIAELLRLSISQPNQHAQNAAWSEDVLKVALEMWKAGHIELNLSTRTAFIDRGLGSSMSFSRYDGNMLEISTGYLLEDEVDVPTWQPLLAYFATEAILFHVARAIFHMDRIRAIQAEHFLHETEHMSRRIDFELSTSDLPTLMDIQRKTNLKLMKYLCMGVHVDTKWIDLPPYVRQVIMCRILGDPVSVSRDLHEWIATHSIDLQTCDFHLEIALGIYEKTLEREHINAEYSLETGTAPLAKSELHCSPVHIGPSKYGFLHTFVSGIASIPSNFTKWVGILTGAGSDVERELWYNVRYWYARGPILWVILSFWRFCWFLKNIWVYVLLIYHRKNLVRISRLAKKGASRTLVKDRVIIEQPRKIITGFATRNDQDSITLDIFDRALSTRPAADVEPVSTAVYGELHRLVRRQDRSTGKDKKANPFVFSTFFFAERSRSRWPAYKEVVDGDNFKRCFYDKYGRVTHGVMIFSGTEYEFTYSYKSSPKNSHEILRAEFKLAKVADSDSFAVYWGVPLRADVGAKLDWVPSDRVCRVVRRIGRKRYTTTSNYAHRRDPTMVTMLEDKDTRCMVAQPPEVFPEEAIMQMRPTDVAFENDDLLIRHHRDDVRRIFKYAGRKLSARSVSTILNPGAWSYFSKKKIYTRVPTWWLRTELWNNWLKSNSLDGITACWMDELILREEPTLQRYWSYRSSGRLTSAKKVLDDNIEQIVAAIEIEKDVSEVCMLPIKAADLYAMGLGKDANQMTTRPEDCFKDTADRISVIFNDVGCWPESPGGVSNCRRDLVNGHSTIRNHVLAESANEYGIPRFQIEKNVQSLKILPLWGLDGKTPNHGVIDNLLQSEVDRKIGNTEIRRDILGTFVPILKQFVKGARTRSFTRPDLLHFSNVMLTMFKYFEHKDYNVTWNSKEVAAAWVEAWLESYDDPNIMDTYESFELSRPTMTDFRDAMAIYKSYFFIFSVQTPENCPQVFQSTHHGISSLFGMLLKYKRGTTFGIWDHAILWRECCLNISPAQCELSIPVQTMLLAGIGLATKLAYFHADVILPCTSFFNPIWEADLGTDRGQVNHRNQFRRKIDPIVNGVGNMDAFEPVDHVRTEVPTVIMLSNVQFIKDVRTAVLAADVIINKFGFKDYKLVVYGAQDREPQYTIDTIKLIQQCKMSDNVTLGGFGRPQEVLKDAWLFMNSSLSEGLPLAIAEAALAGVPIVATSVGATALVLTDPDDSNKKYGEVVPPNDPVALARAQISMLSMVGAWTKFTGEVGEKEAVPSSLALPDVIQDTDVEWLTRRMYEKAEFRRKLGMLSRGVVLKGFHGKRYLREHEQMYWIQWHIAQMRADEGLMASAHNSFRFGAPVPLRYSDVSEEELWAETEDFGVLDVTQYRGNNEESRALEERRTNPYASSIRYYQGPMRKNSIRWQEFPASTRGSFLTIGSGSGYEGKRLSKAPRRPWVESRTVSYASSAAEVA
ncbi:family 4 glycosyltransferase [Cryphonectria parasitica EP155]|uniref:Family 4 glycosyltransferase n=1 Tax=Cryphonectria parasitica (strain ATCC 38755 / EP155) TaxID=660469 RepID=A0A9P4XV65_CRYP1|nr:family 4 glycosyltransferase [Cryphonectria parasitica EP155]KAF3761887.1 family 4 glycosyltransferase [Cryphonectria parasitica EP155]